MSDVVRFGVSLEKTLLDKFDRLIREKNYNNRSEAIRDLIRQELVRKEWHSGHQEVAGAITIVYDHHLRELVNKIVDVQHHYHSIILATQHIHLDHHHCMEVIAVKGKPVDLESLSRRLKSIKGVKHTDLTMTTTGKNLK